MPSVAFLFLVVVSSVQSDQLDAGKSSGCNRSGSHSNESFHVTNFDFQHVKTPSVISLCILIASLAKLGFHLYPRLPHLLPESCLLIALGLFIGGIVYAAAGDSILRFTPDLFFLFLLPPIVFESGFFLRNGDFFRNLGRILLFAVVGTLWNTFALGLCLYAVSLLEWVDVEVPLTMSETFLFASIVSAVDPVAVLAVFEEIHVNELLHILVFGESILNDAVTVVLYRMFEAFAVQETVTNRDIGKAVGSFFYVSIGGLGIGVVFGILTALLTRFTDHVRVIEPIAVFLMGYVAYLCAEMFHLSGIVCLIFAAIVMKHYVDANVSRKSRTTIKYSMKMMSSVSETIIFIFLGVEVVNGDRHNWNTGFVGFTIMLMLVFRFVSVFCLSWIANRFQQKRLRKVDQFIAAYGGIRGAVSFSLVLIVLNENKLPGCTARMMFTTVVAVIFFTSFVLGATIKPLVKAMHVKLIDSHKLSVSEQIADRVVEHAVAGIEDIIGHHGYHFFWELYEYIDINYLQVWLEREPTPPEHEIIDAFIRTQYQALNTSVQCIQQQLCCGRTYVGQRRKAKMSLSEPTLTVTAACSDSVLPLSSASLIRSGSILRSSLRVRNQPSPLQTKRHTWCESSPVSSEDNLKSQQRCTLPHTLSCPSNVFQTEAVNHRKLHTLLKSQQIHPHRRHARHTVYEAEDDDDELAFELRRNKGIINFIQKNSNTPALANLIYNATGLFGANAVSNSLFQSNLWMGETNTSVGDPDERETSV